MLEQIYVWQYLQIKGTPQPRNDEYLAKNNLRRTIRGTEPTGTNDREENPGKRHIGRNFVAAKVEDQMAEGR